MRPSIAAVLVSLGFVSSVFAAVEGWTPRTHQIPKATGPIAVDGELDEQAWSDAKVLSLDFEVQPAENVTPPVKTELLLTWDDRAIYFACRCYDPDPAAIRARLNDRDNLFDDDWIGIMIDTFNDSRRAYEFVVSPLGVQMDALNDDVGGNYDTNWNAIWESAARLTDFGYQVEVRIPYNQLRFPDTDGPLTWGFDAFRSVPRTDRHHIGLWPRDRGSTGYIVQADKVVGFEGADPGRNIEIVPTLTARGTETRDDFPTGAFGDADSEVDVGVTARWGITPNVTLQGAINPDFSQIEADSLQLDINEQFALFFPETRPFFQEGADFFNTPTNLVYTRNVASPDAALKVSGKSGDHTYGLFSARDSVTNLLVPGTQGSSGGSFDFESTATVGRYRFDFGDASTVGGLVTDRRGAGYSNSVIEFDLNYRITAEDRLIVVLADSSTEYNSEMVSDFEMADDEIGGHLALVDYRHRGRSWTWKANYREYDEEFRADLGFQPQVGYSRWGAGGDRRFNPEQGRFFRGGGIGGDVDRSEDADGDLLEEEWEAWAWADMPMQSNVSFGAGVRDRAFEDALYDQSFYWIEGGIRPWKSLRLSGSYQISDHIDFRHNRAADRESWRIGGQANGGRHLRANFEFSRQTLDVAEGHLFTADTPELRLVYQHSTRTFFRAIVQNPQITRNVSVYDDEVDRESESVFAQLLYSYKLNPQTVLFLGYSDNGYGNQDFDVTTADRTLFLKIGYAFLW